MEPNLLELRHYLNHEYALRARLNPNYSRKAFARDLQIPATCLNDFLAGGRALSFKNVERVFKYLSKNEGVSCSWCGKTRKDSIRLIGGARRQFICEPCVKVCNEILQLNQKMA